MIRMFHMLLLVAVVALPAAAQTRDRLGPRDLKDGPRVLEAFASITRGHAGSTMLVLADGKPVALATAVRTEGYLVTKASEISDGDIAVVLPGGGKLEAKVVGEDDAIDLALLRVDADDLKPVAWTDDERDPGAGRWLISAGVGSHPLAVGVVSVPRRKIAPSNGVLGIQLGDERDGGVAVAQVFTESGAEAAGLQVDDVITQIDKHRTSTRYALVTAVKRYRAGDRIKLAYVRDGKTREVEAVLGHRPTGFGGRQARMNAMGGELSMRRDDFKAAVQHDTVITPQQCGGAVYTLDGEAVGINIARAGRTESYYLPADVVRETVDKLMPVTEHEGDASPVHSADEAAVDRQ